MNEISSLSNVIKVSGVKDGIQTKSIKKTDVTFKNILKDTASDTSSIVKNSSNVNYNTAAENKDEDLNYNKLPIKLSGKELAKVKSLIEKLKDTFSNKTDISDNVATTSTEKAKLNLGTVEELLQMNLTQINEILDALKNMDLSKFNINVKKQPLQINQAVIDELSKMTKQISNAISFINNSKAELHIQVSEDSKDILNADLTEHSLNADNNDKKMNELVLELYGMISILSEVVMIKAQQLQSTENKEGTAGIEPLRDIQTINKSLGIIKELLENCSNNSQENQNNYFKLGQIVETIMSSNTQGNTSAVDNKLNMSRFSKSNDSSSELIKILTNNNESLKVEPEIENLINKFIGQADELEQQMKLTKNTNDKNLLKIVELSDNRVIVNKTIDTPEKLISSVRKKLVDVDMRVEKQGEIVNSEDKMNISSENVIKTLEQNSKNSKTIIEDSMNKEDKLLLKISSDDKDSTKDDMSTKIARVTNFTTSIHAEKNLPLEANVKTPVVNRYTFNNDFVKALKYMEVNNVKELTVKVMPKELGELFIKITMEGEVVKAHITATNKEAYNVLNSNLADISNKLSEQNIKIHSFNVEIYNGDSNFFKDGSNNENGNSQNKRKNSIKNLEVEDISNVEDTINDLNNVNALA